MKNFFTSNKWIIKLTSDSITYFIGKIIPGFVGFLTVIILSRLFGAHIYGQFSVVISIIFVSQIIFSGWILQGILRFYSEYDRYQKQSFYENIWRFYLGTIPIGSVLLALILLISRKESLGNILLALFLFSLITGFGIQTTFIQARLKAKSFVRWESIRAILIPVTIVLLFVLFSLKTYMTIIFGYCISYFFVVTLMLIWKKKVKFKSISHFDRDFFKKFIQYGAPLTIWLGSSYLLNISDRYVIAGYCNYNDVGIYSAAYDIITKGLGILFMPIVTAAHPIIMDRWNKKDYAAAFSVLKRGIIYELCLFIPIGIILFIFRHEIIRIGLGPEFRGAENIILPVAGGAFLWRLSMLIHKPLELKKKTTLMAFLVTLALLVNFLSNLYCIPRYGYIAAAYTTLGSFFVYFIGVIVFILVSKKSNE